MPKTKLVCLLPARNCEADLEGYFSSVAQFADGVVALDDGSTDRTGDALAAQPLVRRLLRNPRRDTYSGWDHAANLNKLHAAAADLDPDWILSLDADERIDADDAVALRRIVEREGRPDHVYLVRNFRMVGRENLYDRCEYWGARLYAYESGQQLPAQGLHVPPVPTSIPHERWIKTTIRVKHLAGLTAAARRARFEKYREADPQREFQPSYAHLLDAPAPVRRWRPRPRALPAIAGAPCAHPAAPSDPQISLVITGPGLRWALRETDARVEVVALGDRADAAVRAARGRFVWMLPPNAELTPGAIDRTLAAHEAGYAIVLPHARTDARRFLARGAVLAEHGAALAESPRAAAGQPDSGCSYLRDAVVDVLDEPELAGGSLNLALLDWGYSSFRPQTPSMTLHARPSGLLARQFRRGRDAAEATRVIEGSWLTPLRARVRASAQLAVHQLRVTAPRRTWRDAGAALALVLAGQVAFGVGAAYQLLTRTNHNVSTR